ncbi:P-loop containing nucleoside triphosphate hydrolase protein [Mucidula mucida]|nr:P-loop containing nucleoside triphosphate hydrolase protein [Mucidula mucida]
MSQTIRNAIREVATTQAAASELRALYDLQNVARVIVDGTVAYPRAGIDSESSNEGIAFDLRNLVVVVGANGSGKSTIIKLLTRLYDATSDPESLLLDGLPLSNYCLSDLRRATAVLTQDSSLFALSLGENIGIGYPDKARDDDMIAQAAESGGATHCVEKFESGKDTVLNERQLAEPRMANVLSSDTEHPLAVKLAELKKNTEISGGERQRILASRTFMRLRSKTIRFVVVDEPTSALDSEGEMNLFDNLIKAREGKTMVFITHRFGHLVKRADLILCMKDGAIVESGSHEALISQDGEYAKLYNIQAKAFVNDTGA